MRRWLFFSLLSLSINGIWGLLLVPASGILSPLQIQVLTAAGFVPLMFSYVSSRNLTAGSNLYRAAAFAFSAGLCSSFANVTTYAALAKGGEASTVITITSMYPLVTLVLAAVFLRERFNLVQAAGIFIAVSAIYVFNVHDDANAADSAGPSSGGGTSWMAFTLLALFLNGLAAVALKVATSTASTEFSSLCVSGAYVGFALATVLTQKLDWNIPGKGWLYGAVVAALAALGLIVMMPAYRWGKASVVTALTSLYPAVTVALAVPILGERMDVAKGAAIVLMLAAGVALSYEGSSTLEAHPQEEGALP
jgi:transporter family protein